MTSEHAELVGEMLALERMAMAERLKHAKKRRAQQLKSFAAYEKQLGKDGGKKVAKNKNKVQNGGTAIGVKQKSGGKGSIRFEPSILLLDAASRNDKEEVYSLLNSGVSPDVSNEDGLTALHQCCIDNLEEIVKLLVQFGANVNARDSELWTPLHAAATCGHTDLCAHLCENGAELLAVNADGNMPYDLCEDGKTLDYIESQMANAGVTQDLIDDTRLSAENNMLDILKQLHADGGNLQYTGRNGETPLHIAACNGYIHVTEFLLQQQVDISCKDSDEWQPIHCAACWGQLPVIELLLEHGADAEAKTRNGESALDLCEDMEVRNRMVEIMEEIEQHRLPRKPSRVGDDSTRRRNSMARRGSNHNPHGMKRGSIHDKASIAHRDAAEEAQRLHESLASMSNLEDEDDEGLAIDLGSLPPPPPAFNGGDTASIQDTSQLSPIHTDSIGVELSSPPQSPPTNNVTSSPTGGPSPATRKSRPTSSQPVNHSSGTPTVPSTAPSGVEHVGKGRSSGQFVDTSVTDANFSNNSASPTVESSANRMSNSRNQAELVGNGQPFGGNVRPSKQPNVENEVSNTVTSAQFKTDKSNGLSNDQPISSANNSPGVPAVNLSAAESEGLAQGLTLGTGLQSVGSRQSGVPSPYSGVPSQSGVPPAKTLAELKRQRAQRQAVAPPSSVIDTAPFPRSSYYNGHVSNNGSDNIDRSNAVFSIEQSANEQNIRDRETGTSVKKRYSNTNEVVLGGEREEVGCCSIM